MKIKNLKLKNYKSFLDVNVEFNNFTLIVGANASGKSNLISALRFLKNIMTYGLENAIAVHGGINNIVCSLNPCRNEPVSIEFEIVSRDNNWMGSARDNIAFSIDSIQYKFEIMPYKRGSGYRIIDDELKIKYKCYSVNNKVKSMNEKYKFLDTMFTATFVRKNGKSEISHMCEISYLTDTKIDIDEEKLFENIGGNFFCRFMGDDKKELMLYRLSIMLPPMFSDEYFINIYDFDPKLLKHSCPMTSMYHLQEDGSNLAAVLKNILKSKERMKEFIQLLNNTLPFIKSISVENNFDQSFSYKIRETYSQNMFHSNFLSDGTVSVIAIIIALYFEESSNLIVLEEPERNLHPMLLQTIVEMAKDVSNKRQIVFTTHNAEILKNVDISNVRFVKRRDNGASEVTTPENNETVRTFIKNNLGLDELFLQNLLG